MFLYSHFFKGYNGLESIKYYGLSCVLIELYPDAIYCEKYSDFQHMMKTMLAINWFQYLEMHK